MKMKKISSLLIATMLSCMVNFETLANDDSVTVYVNDEKIEFDVEPKIINDRTMVPMRAIFEKLGATVDWDQTTSTVTSVKDNNTITLTVGIPMITVNGEAKELDVAPCIIDGRTLVPVRAISEAFEQNIDWNSTDRTVKISPLNVNKEAFEKVKNAIMGKGLHGDDSIFVHEEDDTCNTNFLIEYKNDELSFFTSSKWDKVEITTLIKISADSNPSTITTMEIETPYGTSDYSIGGIFPYNKRFIKSLSRVDENLKDDLSKAMNYNLVLIDYILQTYTKTSLYDFGILYDGQK